MMMVLLMIVSNTPSTTLVRSASSGADMTDQYIADEPAPVSPTSTDGWGELENGIHEDHESDKDGWDDMLPLEDPKPSPALANIQAAQKRPVMQTKPQVSIPRPKSTSHVSKDADELWGSIAAPAPKMVAKPLNAQPSASSLDNNDPWAAIAAPPPTTRAKPLSAGRGRGSKPGVPKLGAQRMNRASSSEKF